MEERILRVLALARLPGFGARRMASLVRAGGIDDVFLSPRRFEHLISETALECLEDGSARREAEKILDQSKRHAQSILLLGSPGYPASLSALYDPPPAIFFRGHLREDVRRVAIVGARGATGAGRSIARDIARGLAVHGIEVISGLARGIDGAAHEGALLGNGTTLAVLGSSVDIIYPSEHENLAGRIEKNGAILSELPPGTTPAPAHFPKRNRIIVGLSEAIVVVEAGARSGALITARVALDEGRDVLAVPGRPQDPLAFGPNLLIRDGATLVRGVEDVLAHLGIDSGVVAEKSGRKDPILRELAHSEAKSIDQLAVDTGLATPLLMSRLSELELEGMVERLPGTLFRSAGQA